MPKREIEPTGQHGSSWGLTQDLYPDWEATLREAVASGGEFRARWGAKKEIRYALVERCLGKYVIAATSHSDDGEALVEDAVWAIASKANTSAGEQVYPDWTDYLDSHGRPDHDAFVDQVADAVREDPNLQIDEPSFACMGELPADATFEQIVAKVSELEDQAERAAEDNFASVQAIVASVLRLPDPDSC